MIKKTNTKAIGDRAVGAVASQLMKNGFTVCFPFSDNQRYDLVVEIEGQLKKVQCKSGHLCTGGAVVEFWSSNENGHYREHADYFGVYCEEIDETYLIPVSVVGKVHGYLRLRECKNSQKKNIRWAKDFHI